MKVLFRAAAPLAAGFALLFTGTAMANADGAVYTQTNAPTGNAVHRLDRGPDGLLTPVATYRTGGTGTGATLSSQGAVALATTAGCSSPSTRAPTTSPRSASPAAGTCS